ncbi:hypothetical protein D3C72_1897190 [compost metagenome]
MTLFYGGVRSGQCGLLSGLYRAAVQGASWQERQERQGGRKEPGQYSFSITTKSAENLSPNLNIFTALIEGGFLITIYEMLIKPLFI